MNIGKLRKSIGITWKTSKDLKWKLSMLLISMF